MNENENKFDFKFLNRVMYLLVFVVGIFILKETGILAKLMDVVTALIPFFIGVVICWLSKPIANRLKKFGLGRGISAVISLVIIFALFGLLLSYIIPIMATQITSLVKEMPTLYSTNAAKINEFITNRFHSNYQLPSSLGEMDLLSKVAGDIVDFSITTVQSVFSIIIGAITSVFLSFFLVKDIDKTRNTFIVFASKTGKDSNRYKMLMEMSDILNSYLRGLLIDSVIVGIMTTILCMILKLDYAVLFGLIIMILNLIPYIGAAASHAIIAIFAFTVGGPLLAIISLACSFGIQIIDANILQPNIIGKSVKLNPVTVIVGLLIFEELFGVLGMIIATPIIALGKVFLKYKFGFELETFEESKKRKVKNVTRPVVKADVNRSENE